MKNKTENKSITVNDYTPITIDIALFQITELIMGSALQAKLDDEQVIITLVPVHARREIKDKNTAIQAEGYANKIKKYISKLSKLY